jgi:hypothetical protein
MSMSCIIKEQDMLSVIVSDPFLPLKKYTKMLADMAGVEDLTTLEENET